MKSNKIADLKEGQWAIIDTIQEEKVCANALLATDNYLMYKCYTMEVEGYKDDGKLKDLAPFTMKQTMRRDDWLMFKEALYGHKKIGTFKLYEEEYVFNQGDPLNV